MTAAHDAPPRCSCRPPSAFVRSADLALSRRKDHTLKQILRDALDERGYATLTPVQEAVSAPELQGADMLVSAQTGSGKTVGFGLAIAPALLADAEAFDDAAAPLGLVIAPTRELALQVKRELAWLYAKAGAVIASCVGGMDMRDERRALARGAHIVVATPGRLRDHIMRGSIDLGALRAVVLDEADEMLDLGFREDLEFILGEAPEDRQTLLFSATVPAQIERLAQAYQRDAKRVVAKASGSQHADIAYLAHLVADHDVENAVINALLYHRSPNAIVFANTRAAVSRLTTRLSNRGFRVVALSGELSQSERTHALQAMRDGRADVCVATDVAARGIDLPNLDLVVHAELPSNHETLLHRSGRTGRAGRKGISALIVTRKIRKKAERILKSARLSAEWCDAPSAEAVTARDDARMLSDEVWQSPVTEGERDTVDALLGQFSAEQLAAAYLRLYRAARSAPEDLAEAGARPAPRAEFGPSVWVSVSGGRAAGAEPRRLLPMLCKAGGLTKDDIGAIRIQPQESYVQVRESAVSTLLGSLGADMEIEPGVVLTRMDEAPDFDRAGPASGRREDSPPRPDRRRATVPGPKADRAPRPKRDAEPRQPERDAKPRSAVRDTPKPETEAAAKAEPRAKPDTPRKRPGASDPSARVDGARKRKGPPPPVGKPGSKKNRARAAHAKTGQGGARKGPKR